MFRLAPAGAEKPVVVISDTHFGEPLATLGATARDETRYSSSLETLDVLIHALETLGPLDEIVLLGDIWEMWSCPFRLALQEAAPFLQRLCSLPVDRITYVPGNHDYHLLVQHIEYEQMTCLKRGETPPRRYRPQHTYTDSFLAGLLPEPVRDRFQVKYPDYNRVVGGRRVLFHHGHHLATLRGGELFSSVPMFILKRLEGVGIQTLTREELERGVSIFYEMVYAGSLGDRAADRLHDWWVRVQRWRRWWVWTVLGWMRSRLRRESSLRERGTPQVDIEHFRDAARWMLRLMDADAPHPMPPPDLLVFGHTHRSGIASVLLDDNRTSVSLVNSGCWLVETHKRNTDHVNTLAILDGAHVGVYKLGIYGLELRDAIRFPVEERTPSWP